MVRIGWTYRIQRPMEFPHVCNVCQTERRFRETNDLGNHMTMATRHSSAPPVAKAKQTRQQYIDSDLQTTDSYRSVCNGVVKSIGNILKNNVSPKYRPAEVIKGGSAGKGTAIRGKSDLDLVFFLPREYGTVEKLQMDRENILDDIRKTLICSGYKVVGRSTKALQIQVECNESGTGHCHAIAVDLLPASNLDGYSSDQVHAQMRKTAGDQRKFFSPSLTKQQVDLVSDKPEQLKRLIRFVKDWKNNNIENAPSSFAMELLIIHLWQQGGEPETFTLDNALGRVMEALISYQNLRVEFTEFYDRSQRQGHSAPYIIDPVNPYTNVIARYNHWQEVVDKAKKYLRHNLSNPVRTGFY